MIYAYGGYTGHLTRATAFERYIKETNRWEELNLRLVEGIEAGVCIS